MEAAQYLYIKAHSLQNALYIRIGIAELDRLADPGDLFDPLFHRYRRVVTEIVDFLIADHIISLIGVFPHIRIMNVSLGLISDQLADAFFAVIHFFRTDIKDMESHSFLVLDPEHERPPHVMNMDESAQHLRDLPGQRLLARRQLDFYCLGFVSRLLYDRRKIQRQTSYL